MLSAFPYAVFQPEQELTPRNERRLTRASSRPLRSLALASRRLKRVPLAGPKNERSGPEKGRRAARPDSGLWGRESGQAGLLTRAFSRQRSASLRSLRAAADAPIVSRPEERTFWAGEGPSGSEACFGSLGARFRPGGPANPRIQPTALRFAALAPRCG